MWYTVEETEKPSKSSRKRKNQKMPKKNGFCIFMEERRDGVLAAGHEIPGGKRDLAQLLSADWKALPQEERDKYCEKAKQLNERVQRAKSNPGSIDGKVQKPLANPNSVVTADEMSPEHKRAIEAGRTTVFKIFRTQKWASHPIVICSFSLYNEPEYYHDMYIPAEIGLSAMSLDDGVLDNFARIIDMRSIPIGRNVEFAQMAKKLGIPAPGTVREFTDYESLMMIFESFLKKYQGIFEGQQDELHVYALDSEFGVIRHCLDWLYENSGTRLAVKILSLDLYAFLASSNAARVTVKGSSFDYQKGGSLLTDEGSEIVATVSRFRQVGRPLNETFVHPPNFPMTGFGIFLSEEEVEAAIKKMDNYKYFEELCCVYHIKSGQEVQNCALNLSNRYAFSLLEILTLSNEISIKPGYHYPRVDIPSMEIMKRNVWIQRWGISDWEEKMEHYKPEEYVEEADEKDLNKKPMKLNRRGGVPDHDTQPTVFQPRSKSQRNVRQDDEAPLGMEEEDGAAGNSALIPERFQTSDEQNKSFGRRQQPQIRVGDIGYASSSRPIVEFNTAEIDENDSEERLAYRLSGGVPSFFLGREHR